jgi:hypothetical protein
MGFTTPCFIRKNTQELRRGLEELGYEILNFGNTTLDAHNYDGKGSHKSIEEGKAIITSYGNLYGVVYYVYTITKKGRIDCGTNEELFLAIAALRDDTDKYQWFTDGDKWILCPKTKFSTYWVYYHIDVNTDTIHKATVNELIEHFKTKKEQ